MNSIKLVMDDKKLQRYLRVAPAKIKGQQNKLLRRLSLEGQREARSLAAKTESTLTNSIQAKANSPSYHQIMAGVHYAAYVENGVGPGGSIPDQAFEDWFNTNRITIDIEYDSFKYLVNKRIREQGQIEQPFMRPAYAFLLRRAPALIPIYIEKGITP
jgi:hypothetical protein